LSKSKKLNLRVQESFWNQKVVKEQEVRNKVWFQFHNCRRYSWALSGKRKLICSLHARRSSHNTRAWWRNFIFHICSVSWSNNSTHAIHLISFKWSISLTNGFENKNNLSSCHSSGSCDGMNEIWDWCNLFTVAPNQWPSHFSIFDWSRF
jgi:hypothetical protein